MQFRQLEAFMHVAELGSYTRAAEILKTTQPALSHLVRQLETRFRQHLLTRNGRGVAVTEAGKILLSHAKSIVEQCARAEQDMAALHGALEGHFSLGLLTGVARTSSLKIIEGFKEMFPHATISIREGFTSYLIEWLQIGRVDAAVVYDTSPTPLIEKRALFEQELGLIGPQAARAAMARAIPFSTLGNYPLITTGRMHGIRQAVDGKAAEMGIPLKIALEVDSVASILELVSAGYGFAVLPLNAIPIDADKRTFSTSRLCDPTPTIQLVLGTSTRHYSSALAKRAIDMVHAIVMETSGKA